MVVGWTVSDPSQNVTKDKWSKVHTFQIGMLDNKQKIKKKEGCHHVVLGSWSGALAGIYPEMAHGTNGQRCTLFTGVCQTLKKKMRGVITHCQGGGRVDCQVSFPKWAMVLMVEGSHFQRGMPDLKKIKNGESDHAVQGWWSVGLSGILPKMVRGTNGRR